MFSVCGFGYLSRVIAGFCSGGMCDPNVRENEAAPAWDRQISPGLELSPPRGRLGRFDTVLNELLTDHSAQNCLSCPHAK
jgi:hypothetical protein